MFVYSFQELSDVKHDTCVSEISDRTKLRYVPPTIRSWVRKC